MKHLTNPNLTVVDQSVLTSALGVPQPDAVARADRSPCSSTDDGRVSQETSPLEASRRPDVL